MKVILFGLSLFFLLIWIRVVSYLIKNRAQENRAHKKMHMKHCGRTKEQISIQHNFAKAIFLFASNLRYGK